MNITVEPVTTDLVLIGGGHSHAIALRMFGMNPLPGVRLTLITEVAESAYSGMLPGRVAGFYSDRDCHVNLFGLTEFAQAQLYLDRVVGLDLATKHVLCANRPPVAFDVLSIDIGSTPTLPAGMKPFEDVIPAKPVPQFLHHWDTIVAQVQAHPARSLRLGIVGGGAGGVELALNMQRHLHTILEAAGQPVTNLDLHLIQRGDRLLPHHTRWVRDRVYQLLSQRDIQIHFNEDVKTVRHGIIHCQSGFRLSCDFVIWVTQASAQPWLEQSGLVTDDHGFIQVNAALQSLSHPWVFAAGDIATMVNYPRPKAGVFAVRQAKPLFHNLRRFIQNRPLQSFRPQKIYLSLIGTANNEAIASWNGLGYQSTWLWDWKDYIDRRFMARLNDLPTMPSGLGDARFERLRQHLRSLVLDRQPATAASPVMYCAGCGSKVSSSVLERVFQRIQQPTPRGYKPARILIGLEAPDDGAVIQMPANQVLVQTVDYFPALLNDPYIFGKIAATHALSDVFAMGATPHSALAIATLPHGTPTKLEETLFQLLSGALSVLQTAGAELIGGHTTEGNELAFGLACNGLAAPQKILRKSGGQPGQALIVTKAIGTGTLFAAKMQRQARGWELETAMQSMMQSNQLAAKCLQEFGATACTDVTGFGLLGHLLELLRASQVAVELDLDAIPVLPGAQALIQQGLVSSLQAENERAIPFIRNYQSVCDRPSFPLLFDPQTSGGLLATVPSDRARDCVAALQQAGYFESAIVGYIVPRLNPTQPVTIT